MADQEGYSPRNRAERLISAGRVLLAFILTVAVAFEPGDEGLVTSEIVRIVTFGYLAYSTGVFGLTWRRRVTTRGVVIATHVIDLLIFSALMFLTNGTVSPFFPYFVFATLCGAIRWHGRGAVLTGAAALAGYVIGSLTGAVLHPAASFDTTEFISRCAQLALVAGLLGYMGAYQRRLQEEIQKLAAWPRRLPTRGPEALQEVLTYAASVLRVPRIVLVWEEGDEPSLRIAIHEQGQFDLSRERPDAYGDLVAGPLEASSFVCTGLQTRRSGTLQRVAGGFRYWNGRPFDETFLDRYRVNDAMALKISTDSIAGWLFALDRPRLSADDLLLGDVVARLVAGALELQTLIEQLRESAAGEERVHLARELHDGVLQSLTAASLQAQRARQAMITSPAEAERRLATVEETILAEQQALRLAIEDLKPGAIRDAAMVDVIPRLRDAATRVAQQWDVKVHLNLQRSAPSLPRKIAHELTRMLQEALVNAIRHGAAREVTVTCIVVAGELALAVSYRGRGFSGFNGRHELESLRRMNVGPRTLMERVLAVGGALVIESGDSGARVEIRLRITPAR